MGNGETKELVRVDKGTGEIMTPANPFSGIQINELNVASNMVSAFYEMVGALQMAKQFPRNEKAAFQRFMGACQRKSLADKACYSYPRGGSQVEGPSVNIARVAAQNWGNVRWGMDILKDTDDERTIVGWAWDLENNIKVPFQDTFKKLVQRKDKQTGTTKWVTPDERDLRELTNKRGAILMRNAILNILPRDYIEDGIGICRETIRSNIKDPKSESKKLMIKFNGIGVTTEMIDAYLGHDIWTPDDIVELQGILIAITEKASKVEDYFNLNAKEVKPPAGLSDDDMVPGDVSTHQDIKGQKPAEELPLDQPGPKGAKGKGW